MILITEFMDEDAVATLVRDFGAVYAPELADNQGDIPDRVSGFRALIVRNRTQVTGELLAAAPDLICVGRLGVGLDNIDVEACKARDVAVFPATGANNLSVVEYVLTTAMMLLRGAYRANDQMLAGQWPRQTCAGREISGTTLGLVGYGAIAQDLATKAIALGMDVVAHDPFLAPDDGAWKRAENLPLPDVFRRADVVSLHVPLTPETRHVASKDMLSLMQPGAILINAARGGVVDETALVAHLKSRHLGGAALDVFENEPLAGGAEAAFNDVPNLILTPHIGGVTEQSNQRVSAMIADKVAAHLNANPT